MSTWRFGALDRSKSSRSMRHFAPSEILSGLLEVDLERLWASGKRLILLDVDNTLVHWKSEDFDPKTVEWVQTAKRKGFSLCILSNTKHPERLARIGKFLGVDTLRGRFKPSRQMFFAALEKYKATAEQAIMIGDQIMTDILGANRAGIDAVLLKPMHHREFFGTKFNRALERAIRPKLFKMMPVTEEANGAEAGPSIKQQIVRFVVVGGTSFVIDAGLTFLLMKKVQFGDGLLSDFVGQKVMNMSPFLADYFHTPFNAAAPILGGTASFIAMFNSFWLNRKWTFEAEGHHHTLTQMHRFYTVSILGSIFNALLFSFFLNILLHESILPSKILAAGLVAFWSYFGQRYYAFRPPKTSEGV